MPTAKKQSTYRLSDEGREMQRALSAKLGLPLSGVLELAIRRLAEAEGIQISTKPGRKGKATK